MAGPEQPGSRRHRIQRRRVREPELGEIQRSILVGRFLNPNEVIENLRNSHRR
jgi:hypothetical protein